MILPDIYFLSFEILVSILFLLCFIHSQKTGLLQVLELIAGVLFGLLLEWTTLQQLQAYEYGQFTLMLGKVPVMIGVAWGVIIYSARLFSNATNLPEWGKPILNGLLALNIDLSMDAVAIRLGMWDWAIGFQKQYFGVPYANFWAWFWVVFSFTLSLQLFSQHRDSLIRWLAPVGAIAFGTLGVLTTNALIVFVIPHQWYRFTIALVLGAALFSVLIMRPKVVKMPPRLVFWVLMGFHGYFLAAGLISGVILQPIFLLLMSILMAGIALLGHGKRRALLT